MPTLLIADDHPLHSAVQRVMPHVQLYEADSVEALYALADRHADADLLLEAHGAPPTERAERAERAEREV